MKIASNIILDQLILCNLNRLNYRILYTFFIFVSIFSATLYFGLVRTHFSEPKFIYYIDSYVISTRLVRTYG